MYTFYGHTQCRTKGYLSRVSVLQLPKVDLATCNVSALSSLKVLDLSENRLTVVSGLETLAQCVCSAAAAVMKERCCLTWTGGRLMYLDVSGNKPLDVNKTLWQLTEGNPGLHTLVQVRFHPFCSLRLLCCRVVSRADSCGR
jgi:hypothetical protein